jgi:uncharacterized membrane protein YdfJ with MMPL/SSD domain
VPATMRLLGNWNWWLPFHSQSSHNGALSKNALAESSVPGEIVHEEAEEIK